MKPNKTPKKTSKKRASRFIPQKRVIETKAGKLNVIFNQAGKQVLKRNHELLYAFRTIKNTPLEQLIEKARQGIDLGYAKISHLTSRLSKYYSVEPSHILRITLRNGREFAFKIANKSEIKLMQDLVAGHEIRQAGQHSIKHYVQFQFSGTGRYFVLMEYSKLPLYKEYLGKLMKRIAATKSKKVLQKLQNKMLRLSIARAEAEELERKGLIDAEKHNMLVRDTGNTLKIILFDVGLEKSKKPIHFIE